MASIECLEIHPSTSSLIFFDLETSDFFPKGEILEIGAVCDEKTFDVYIVPERPPTEAAAAVNNITMVNNVLYYKGQKVVTESLEDALQKFFNFLEGFPKPRFLLGHNIKTFDCRFICSAVAQLGLADALTNIIEGFIDTLPLYRELIPDLINHQQATIVKHVLNTEYEEHNALADVISLQNAFNNSTIDEVMLKKNFFLPMEVANGIVTLKNKKELMQMTKNARNRIPLTEYMIGKITKAGLAYSDLLLAYSKNGKPGLEDLLKGQDDGITKIFNEQQIRGASYITPLAVTISILTSATQWVMQLN